MIEDIEVKQKIHGALCVRKESKHGLSGGHAVGPAEKYLPLAGLVFGGRIRCTEYKKSEALGLVSMAERIYQVNGTLNIDSQPNAGTWIRARAPLATQPKVMTAAVS